MADKTDLCAEIRLERHKKTSYHEILDKIDVSTEEALRHALADCDCEEVGTMPVQSENDEPWAEKFVLEQLYIEDEKRLTEIADLLGCHPSTVQKCVDELGVDSIDSSGRTSSPTVNKLQRMGANGDVEIHGEPIDELEESEGNTEESDSTEEEKDETEEEEKDETEEEESVDDGLTELQQRILDIANEADDGASYADMHEMCEEAGIDTSYSTVYATVKDHYEESEQVETSTTSQENDEPENDEEDEESSKEEPIEEESEEEQDVSTNTDIGSIPSNALATDGGGGGRRTYTAEEIRTNIIKPLDSALEFADGQQEDGLEHARELVEELLYQS